MSTDGNPPPVTVDILPDGDNPPPWNPQPGPETNLLDLPPGARDQIVEEACRILRRCVDPNGAPQTQTGLVMGYVQSGKTTSFTTVTALARDNGYRLVIVIAGTTDPLFLQNRDRIIEALRLESRPRSTLWRHVSQPKVRENAHVAIRDTLAQWDAPTARPEERRTVLVTVMKHHQHLQSLIDVLQHMNLQNVPTLLIDDEGDQAGLNTQVRQGDECRRANSDHLHLIYSLPRVLHLPPLPDRGLFAHPPPAPLAPTEGVG